MALITLKSIGEKLKAPNVRTEETAIPTFRDVVIDSLMYFKAKDGSTSIRMFRLAERLLHEDTVDEVEFQIIKEIVNQNPSGFFTWVHGQAMQKILEWERGV